MTAAFISFRLFSSGRSLYHLRFAKRLPRVAKTPLFAERRVVVVRAARATACSRFASSEIGADCYERITASRTRRRLDGSHGVRDGG